NSRINSQSAGGVSRNAGVAFGGRHDGTGDRRADGTDSGVGARQSSSRDETVAREARFYGGRMNEDYLWDKSGEPDPQIQQLEEILGTLRYQLKPLQLPQQLSTARRR